ncbi:unnamed protein product [Mytilus coruscus]|uniref:B box-type domain-containing protein n=1 Tax=Mytilus coruscus TaxID=42192 RepID=A0A6J8ERS5_MYTCO|nr:unnamed protein product [Mytilus coruscus]
MYDIRFLSSASSKVLEAFCVDHQELCCVFCLALHHRKCKNVQVIEEIKHLKKDRINALVSAVTDAKVKVETMIKEKRVYKEKFDTTFAEIEATVCTENCGAFDQILIHFEKAKTELKSVLTEASKILNTALTFEAVLVESAILVQVENVNCLGEHELKKAIPIEMNAYVKQLLPPNSSVLSKIHPFISFDNIILKHIKTIDLHGFDVYCGIFVSDEVVGGKVGESVGKLKAIHIHDERIVDECPVLAKVKRLTFDFESDPCLFLATDQSCIAYNLSTYLSLKITLKKTIITMEVYA